MEDIEKRGLPRYLTAYLNYKLGNVDTISDELFKEVPNDLKECVDCIVEGKAVPDPNILASYPIYFKEEIIEEVEEHDGSKCKTPVASPAAGSYDSAQTVTLTCATDGATIYYTTDGSDPTSESTEYTSEITISTITTLKAIAIKDELDDSDILNAVYTISVSKVATPAASIPSGSDVEVGSTVALSCETNGTTIYYTTDGSTPTSSSTEYTQAITINVDTTIKAIAIKSGMEDSDVLSASYKIIDYDTVAFADLDTYLQGKEANTTSTPYKIKITGLTAEDCKGNDESEETSPLGEILISNSTKYVDLSPTVLVPDEWGELDGTFINCSSLVIGPNILNNVSYMRGTFQKCTSLTSVLISMFVDDGYIGLGEEEYYPFKWCDSLQHIYCANIEITCLVKEFTSHDSSAVYRQDVEKVALDPSIELESLLDDSIPSVVPEVTPDYTFSFDELDERLAALDDNTASTPYKIKITGLTTDSFYYWDEAEQTAVYPVRSILQNNSTKYVDLRPTIIPDGSNLVCAFSGCTSLVAAPNIPSSSNTDFASMFLNCTSLKSVVLDLPELAYANDMFIGCSSLESIRLISPLNYINSWTSGGVVHRRVDFKLFTDSDSWWLPWENNITFYVDSDTAKYIFYYYIIEKEAEESISSSQIVVDPITNSNDSGDMGSIK